MVIAIKLPLAWSTKTNSMNISFNTRLLRHLSISIIMLNFNWIYIKTSVVFLTFCNVKWKMKDFLTYFCLFLMLSMSNENEGICDQACLWLTFVFLNAFNVKWWTFCLTFGCFCCRMKGWRLMSSSIWLAGLSSPHWLRSLCPHLEFDQKIKNLI